MNFEIHNEQLVSKTGYRVNDIRLATDIVESSISKYKEAWKKVKEMSISVIFVNKREIAKLNSDFRSKKEVTDVLSFDVSDRLAEIYICPEYIEERLKSVMERNKLTRRTLVTEFIRLFIHGVLHVAGYDHEGYLPWDFNENNDNREEMFVIQEEILKDVIEKSHIIFN